MFAAAGPELESLSPRQVEQMNTTVLCTGFPCGPLAASPRQPEDSVNLLRGILGFWPAKPLVSFLQTASNCKVLLVSPPLSGGSSPAPGPSGLLPQPYSCCPESAGAPRDTPTAVSWLASKAVTLLRGFVS